MVVLKLVKDGEVRRSLRGHPLSWEKVVAHVQRVYGEGMSLKYVDDDGDEVNVDCEEEFREALNFASPAGVLRLLVANKASGPPAMQHDKAEMQPAPSPVLITGHVVQDESIAEPAPEGEAHDVPTIVPGDELRENLAEGSPVVDNCSCKKPVGGARSTGDIPLQSCSEDSDDTADARPIHEGITCDVCGLSPIRGIRYKCCQCPDFDLCETCEMNGGHADDHVLLKMKVPVVRHGRHGWPTFLPQFFGSQFGPHPRSGHFWFPPPPAGHHGFSVPSGDFESDMTWFGPPGFAEGNENRHGRGHGHRHCSSKRGSHRGHHHHHEDKARKAPSSGSEGRSCGSDNTPDFMAEVLGNVAQTIGECLTRVAGGPAPQPARSNGQEGQGQGPANQQEQGAKEATDPQPTTGATDCPGSILTDQQVAAINRVMKEMGFPDASINTPYIHSFAGNVSTIIAKLLQVYNP